MLEKILQNNQQNKALKLSISRLIAIQALYQYSFYQASLDISLLALWLVENYCLDENEEMKSYQGSINETHLKSLISGIILVLPEIDQEIKLFLKEGWKIENLPDVILSILRLATFELKFLNHIPAKVIISSVYFYITIRLP